jgi:hypothetical protein
MEESLLAAIWSFTPSISIHTVAHQDARRVQAPALYMYTHQTLTVLNQDQRVQ